MYSKLVVASIGAFCLLGVVQCGAEVSHSIEFATDNVINYTNPVRSAQEDLVEVNRNISNGSKSKMYAGYLKGHLDGKREHFLYYWLIESESDQPQQDPLVLWFAGGPGTSSLKAATSEGGPIELHEAGAAPVTKNWSWNKKVNMLYIDSPVGVGYSYSPGVLDGNLELSDTRTQKANELALKNFMQKFPHLANNSLYLTGNSYAGVYVTMLAHRLNEEGIFNLKGIMIENGALDRNLQESSMLLKAYYYGIMGDADWKSISDACCQGRTPSRENCEFDRLLTPTRCNKVAGTINAQAEAFGLDLGNIYGKHQRPVRDRDSQISIDRTDRMFTDIVDTTNTCITRHPNQPLDHPFSFDARQRALLHIPSNWAPHNRAEYCFYFAHQIGGLKREMTSLIESKRNLTIFIYNGDTDFKCDFLGTKWFIEGLGRQKLSEFEPWRNAQGHVLGFVQQFDGLTFATVLGGGHSPSREEPELGFKLFNLFLESEDKRMVNLTQTNVDALVNEPNTIT